jgi:AraC-like DNA-binding protein
MNAPFSLRFPEGTRIEDVQTVNFQQHALGLVPYATGTFYQRSDFFIFQQSYQNFLTYMEFYQGQMQDNLNVKLCSDQDTLFFIYLLDGSVIMQDELTGENVIQAVKGQYYAHFIPAGDYQVRLPPGKYNLFYFVIRFQWFADTMDNSMIYSLVARHLEQNPIGHYPLPVGEIDAQVQKLLLRLQHCSPVNPMKLDIQVLLILEKLLAGYEHRLHMGFNLPKDHKVLANILRLYIHDGIQSGHQINVSELAQQLFTTPKTLQRHFYQAFGQSPQSYITHQKMKKAYELILNTAHSLQEIATMLGYDYYSSFSRKFRQHHHFSPGQLRTP